jgi:hypothetical protein
LIFCQNKEKKKHKIVLGLMFHFFLSCRGRMIVNNELERWEGWGCIAELEKLHTTKERKKERKKAKPHDSHPLG